VQTAPSADAADERHWESRLAAAAPAVDASGAPAMQIRVGDLVTPVGLREQYSQPSGGFRICRGPDGSALTRELKATQLEKRLAPILKRSGASAATARAAARTTGKCLQGGRQGVELSPRPSSTASIANPAARP